MDYEVFLEKIQNTVKKRTHLFGPGAYEISLLPGWIPLVDQMLAAIDTILESAPGARVQIVTIKEKFGSLRVYYGTSATSDNLKERIGATIGEVEQRSESICMVCGEPGRMEEDYLGVFSVKCEEHSGKEIEFENLSLHAYAKHEDEMMKILKLA